MAKDREGLPLGEGLRLRLCYLPLTHWEALAEVTFLSGLVQGPSWCSEGWETGLGSGWKSSPLHGAGVPSYSEGKRQLRGKELCRSQGSWAAQLLLCSNPSSRSPLTAPPQFPGLPGGWGGPTP